MRLWRYLWPLPITIFGLILAAIVKASGGICKRHGNALEASNGAASRLLWIMNPWGNIEAITLGHVVLARDPATAARLRTHEHTHVRQYERWGIIFPFAYLASSAIAVIKGGDAYRDNVFEREAFSVQFVENQHRLHVDIENSKPH
jgi:hypothetical protein